MIKAQDVLAALEEHTNVLLYGPPGTGKSHLMKEVENLFRAKHGTAATNVPCIDTTTERNAITEVVDTGAHTCWVTFHQGYSYEDFVVGLRPKAGTSTAGTGLALEARAGALVELAARSRTGHGLLLIDEINRGNASRIFGEFITLMEADKRLDAHGSENATTVTVTLPYVGEGEKIEIEPGLHVERRFQMPRRVYTLASMNSVDKSVAPIDSAIRRRFNVIHLRPTEADIADAAGVSGSKNAVADLAVRVVTELNRGIGLYLGPDYMLGQYYLPSGPKLGEMEEAEAKKKLTGIWRHRLLPQLVELFQARPTVCMSLLRLGKLTNHSGLEVTEPSDSEVDEGASPFVVNAEASRSDDEIYAYLENFAALASSQAKV